MDRRFADFDDDESGSIYEYAARSALALYKDFVKGTPSATLAVISEHSLPPQAVSAIKASAERLGYGRDSCFWVAMRGDSREGSGDVASVKLGDQDLRTLLESVDPLSLIATDAFCAHALENAYGEPCQVNSVASVNGRPAVFLGDFPLMLQDEEGKQRAWHLMKALRLD